MTALMAKLVAAKSANSSNVRNQVAHENLDKYAKVLDFPQMSIAGSTTHQATGGPYTKLLAHFRQQPSEEFRPQTLHKKN